MRIIWLAIRNLNRHRRRSVVTGLTILLGALAIVMLQGVANALVKNIVETAVLAKVGAIQVFRAGYLGSQDPLRSSIPDDPALVARIEAIPGVTAVAPRLDFDGTISNGSESTMFVGTAIDPEREYRVCPARKTHVEKGSTPLSSNNARGALVGKTLAESLGAQKEGSLVLQAAGPHAAVNALDVTVHGFLPLTQPMESKRLVTVPLSFAQDLLRMKGLVTGYVASVSDVDQVDVIAARVRDALGSDYQVTTWRELDPGTRDRTRVLSYMLGFIAFVLFVLVATGIVNTTMMSVYERVREIGTLLAIGVRRRQISQLFVCEAVALGISSAILGASVGAALIARLGHTGVTARPVGGDPVTYYPYLPTTFLVIVVGATVVNTLLAALYPAWKASRLRPVEALRAT